MEVWFERSERLIGFRSVEWVDKGHKALREIRGNKGNKGIGV